MIENTILWEASYFSDSEGWVSLEALTITTDKLELSSSIYSLFAYGEWIFRGDPSLLEDKIIVEGRKLKFVFKTNTEDVTKYMSIFSFINGPGVSATSMGEAYFCTLISPWYFSQYSKSLAYYGSISETIKSMITSEILGAFNNIFIDKTYDEMNAVHYRTKMTQGKFIESLKKQAIGKDNKAIFMFTTCENNFYIKEYSENIDTTITAIGLSHKDLPSYQNQINTYPNKFVFMNALQLKFNKDKEDAWLEAGAGLSYVSALQGRVKGISEEPLLPILSPNQTQAFAPLLKSKGAISKVYSDDSLLPYSHIFSETINMQSYSLMKAHVLDLFCLPQVFVIPGKFCHLHITKEDTNKESLFSRNFMIESVSHIFTGMKGSTTVSISSPGISYDDVEKVEGLLYSESE
jgi:hypothetical protein